MASRMPDARVGQSFFGPRLALSGRDGLCRSRLEGPVLKRRGPALHFALSLHQSTYHFSSPPFPSELT